MTVEYRLPVMRRANFWLVAIAGCAFALFALTGGGTHPPVAAQDKPAAVAQAPQIFTAGELAFLGSHAAGKTEEAWTAALTLLKDAPKPDASRTERERYAALCAFAMSLANDLGDWRRVVNDWRKLPPHPHVLTKSMTALSHLGDEKGRTAAAEQLGYIDGWLVCGPFDNERGMGYATAYPPQTERPNFTQEYRGKGEMPVKWRTVPVTPRGDVDLNAMLRPNDETLAYAFTIIEAPVATRVRIGLGTDEGYRLWINGHEAACGEDGKTAGGRDIHRSYEFDQDVFEVELAKGPNTILLKVTEEDGNWGFGMRVTPIDAAAGATVTRAAPMEQQTWEQKLEALAKVEFAPPDVRRLDAAPRDASDARAAFWGAVYEIAYGTAERKDRVALNLLETLKGKLDAVPANERQHVCYALAKANVSTAETQAGVDENRRRELLEQVLAVNPGHVPVLLELADYYDDTLHNPAESARFARRVLETLPLNIKAHIALARSYAARGMTAEYERLTRDLSKRKVGHPMLRRYLGYFEQQGGNEREAHEHYTAALEGDADDGFSRTHVIRRLVQQGDMTRVEELVTAAKAFDPFGLTWYTLLAEAWAGQGREDLALNQLELALTIAPQDDNLLTDAARMSQRLADTTERTAAAKGVTEIDGIPVTTLTESRRSQALSYYKRALARNPRRADIKRYLEFIENVTSVWETRLQREIGDVIAAALEAKPAPDDIARCIYSDEICRVLPDGTDERFHHVAFKITNDEGREALQTYIVRTYGDMEERVVEARVHRPGGEVAPSKVEKHRLGSMIVNPPLNVGDVFEIRWRTQTTARSFWGDYFGDIQVFVAGVPHNRQWVTVPIERMRYVYVLPAERTFYTHTRNGAPASVDEQRDGHTIRTWEMSGVARIENEPLSPSAEQLRPAIYISTFKDWGTFGEWYWKLIERQLKPTPALSKTVRELTDGLTDEKAKVRAIYNYVVKKVRYNSNWEFGIHGYKPYEAGTIFDRGIGDCKDKAILICTMLRETGVMAHPVIISMENFRGIEDTTSAMPHHFNHCIACVHFADGATRFLDGTTTYNSYDEFPSGDAGAKCMVVVPNGTEIRTVPLPPAEANGDRWAQILTFTAAGDATLTSRNDPLGQEAAKWRGILENEGSRTVLLDRWMSEDVVGAKSSNVQSSKLDNLDERVWWSFDASMPGYAKAEGEALSVTPIIQPVRWTRSGIGALTSRVNDLVLPPPFGAKVTITIKPPAGYAVKDVPAAVNVASKYYRYSLAFAANEDGSVSVTREWALTAAMVPAAEYPAFRADLAKGDTAEKTALTFKKK